RRRDALDRDPEPAARHLAVLLELGDDALAGVRRHREADPDRAARGRVDRGVDADHLARQVEGRPARIAAVDRRVELDEIVVRALVDVAAQRRDDPRRDRAAEAERAADRHDPLPGLALVLLDPGAARQLLFPRDVALPG